MIRVRLEPWGAWARVPEHGLVAIDLEARNALFPHLAVTPERPLPPSPSLVDARLGLSPAPLEVHLAVTGRCGTGCPSCYLDATPEGAEPTFDELLRALDAIARSGAFVVAFGGGEPTLRSDLGELAREAKARGLSPVVTTSGLRLSTEKRARLRDFDGVNVSLDGVGEIYAHQRGLDGAADAIDTIRALASGGTSVGVNVVLTRTTLPSLTTTLDAAASAGANRAQLLRFKPGGRVRTRIDYLAQRLDPQAVLDFPDLLRALTRRYRDTLSIRIDCAMVPWLSEDAELASRADDLRRLGVLGCEAGRHLAAVSSRGRLSPCSFLPDTSAPVEGLADRPAASHVATGACATCTLSEICRGGCRAVSDATTGGTGGPDPECPRVRRLARQKDEPGAAR